MGEESIKSIELVVEVILDFVAAFVRSRSPQLVSFLQQALVSEYQWDTETPLCFIAQSSAFQTAGGWSPLCCPVPCLQWERSQGEFANKHCGKFGPPGGHRWGSSYSSLPCPSLWLTTHVHSVKALWERWQVGIDSLCDKAPWSSHQPVGLWKVH